MNEENKREDYSKIKQVRKVQLTCPKCKYEFPFNLGDLDTRKQEVGQAIQSIMKQLSEYKTLSPDEQKSKAEWKRKTSYKLNCLKEEYSKLKTKAKGVHDELDRQNYSILKQVIKEFYGFKEFERCINEVIERGKAYNIGSTMNIDNYTHSKGTIIKKI